MGRRWLACDGVDGFCGGWGVTVEDKLLEVEPVMELITVIEGGGGHGWRWDHLGFQLH